MERLEEKNNRECHELYLTSLCVLISILTSLSASIFASSRSNMATRSYDSHVTADCNSYLSYLVALSPHEISFPDGVVPSSGEHTLCDR